MDILQLIPLIYGKLIIFTLAFTRVSALLTTFVLFKRELMTSRLIIALSAILAYFVIMSYSNAQVYYDIYSMQMLIQMLFQLLIGIVAGLILNIVFEVFIAIGQITSTQIGLSMASLIDPRFGYVTSLTHFYMMVATILFLLLNGHLFAIETIVDSFKTLPVTQSLHPETLLRDILTYSSVIFSGSVIVTLSIILVLLLTNIALAVMSKFAPQFNLFTIGINIQVILGLICIYITFRLFLDGGQVIINNGVQFFEHAIMRLH